MTSILGKARPLGLGAVLAVLGLLGSCGGGSDSIDPCRIEAQRDDLRSYMRSWYLYNREMPDPDRRSFGSIIDYYFALLYRPFSEAGLPAVDRWSFAQSTESFQQFFGAGQDLGYGLSVAGLDSDPLPLRVRYIAPGSPAERAGLVRGQIIDLINGADPAFIKADGQGFPALSPDAVGEELDLRVRDNPAALARDLTLRAEVFRLTPVSQVAMLSSPARRTVGYLHYKDFIAGGAGPTLQAAFLDLRSRGVTELVLDMRYNGGGSVNVSRELASLIAGSSRVNQVYATLQFNAEHQDANFTYAFVDQANALGLNRVVVLAGPRTCSASELVVNGLRGVGVNVQIVGGTSCGKPFGFLPYSQCGNTYSAVNFRSVNALGRSDYEAGLAPDCPVVDDLDHPQGRADEALTAAALTLIDTGACPAAAPGLARRAATDRLTPRRLVPEGDGAPGMHAD
jgi:carboxyl-terminal processing protease